MRCSARSEEDDCAGDLRGHPPYRFSSDEKPRDLDGQGFIDAWYVVSPAGKPVEEK
jgi:predicted lipoprotein with Yx(FWY)xxD motif